MFIMRKIVEPPRRDYRCISAKMYWGQMTTEQPDEVDDKTEPEEFLQVPWIVCKAASSRPYNTKPSPTSDSIFLRAKRKLISWLRDYCR